MKRIIKTASLTALITTVPLGVFAMPMIAQRQSPQYQLKKERTTNHPVAGSTILVQPCPEGQKRIIWEQPIYDENGLFVVGHKKVAICVPKNGTPAG